MAPPPAPPVEEDPFEQLPVEEVDTDYYEEPAPRPTPAAPAQRERQPEPQPEPEEDLSSFLEPEPAPAPQRRAPVEPDMVEDEESTFVNKKQKKLLPFGGAKSKQVKRKDGAANVFDAREDRRKKAFLVQAGALAALFGIVGFGAYNAINPPAGVSPTEMNAAIGAAIATQNFPQERGGAFAEDFLATYLTIDPNDATNAELLGYYYTGQLGGASGESTLVYSDVAQRIVSEPKVYKFTPLDMNSAAFEVGALVEPIDVNAAETEEGALPVAERFKWVYYNVNVYYDETTDTMAITPDSPTLIPAPNFGSAQDLPDEKLLGTGETSADLDEAVNSSLLGYFEQFAEASPASHEGLDQYLLEGAASGPELLKGLGGQFRLAGEPASAIDYTTYATGEPGVVKIDATVSWQDASVISDNAVLTYTSRYYVEMRQQENGQWLVSAFAPKYFLKSPDAP